MTDQMEIDQTNGTNHDEAEKNVAQDQQKLLAFFESKDSVMEVDLFNKMKEYISNGGQPQVAVKLMAENYRGLAQMSNLLCQWLRISGVDSATVVKMVEDHLKQIILKSFDPKKADTIFSEGAGAPAWLEHMISQPSWRSMIYQLAETYRNCLMLNFAIQRISDEGHQTEIASLTTASTYFGVFNRVLKDSLAHMCTLDEISLSQALPDFKKMCAHSQHTYLYSQSVLHSLMSDPKYFNIKRLSQELENSVLERGSVIQNISFFLSSASDYPVVAGSVASIVSAGATNPSDVLKLHNVYSQPNPPPVEILRHPLLFDIFIRDLFNPVRPVNSNFKSKYFYVLAYAAAGRDDDKKGEFEATLKALEIIHPICMRNSFGSELQAAVEDLQVYLDYPVVAACILHWIRVNFSDSDYYTTSFNTLCIPIHLGLLRDISYQHPLQRPLILDLLTLSFDMKTGLDALAALDVKRSLLDNMIYLMQCGFVPPVMDAVERMAARVDQSLIRYFILQVLEMVDPPYSPLFMESMLRIMEKQSTIESLKGLKDVEKKRMVSLFVDHCHQNSTVYENQKATLQKLKEVL